ncbi:transposase [Lacticaseibacillus saniviri]
MPRAKYTAAEKYALLEEFRLSDMSQGTFEKQHGLSDHRLKIWKAMYERDGFDGLQEVTKNRHYSAEFKLAAVLAYNAGEGTLDELVLRFGLRSQSTLRDWVFKYNKDKTVTASPFRKQVPTMSRKTTFEERIEVVEYVTKLKNSYAETAEHFHVSYQQVRLWVIKAKDGGYEALVDNRGHRKKESELTENDKLNLEIRQLKAQLADKELIEKFAKKMLELQRRG